MRIARQIEIEYVFCVFISLILCMIYIIHIQEYSTLILAHDRRDP
jgi:tetrahydromethanopterin S-methyltransferase subunit G